jgi:hypothetical protein
MENLNLKGAKLAAIVVAIGSIAYGIIPKTIPTSNQVPGGRVCGSILFPGTNAASTFCAASVPAGLLWVIIVASVSIAIYSIVEGNDDNS